MSKSFQILSRKSKKNLDVSEIKYSLLSLHTSSIQLVFDTHHTHTHLTALFPGLPRWAGTRKVKPIWISLEQETVSGSGISWAICKPAPCSRQTTTPAPHHSAFYRPDALPAAQPTVSKHWRHDLHLVFDIILNLTRTREFYPIFHSNKQRM